MARQYPFISFASGVDWKDVNPTLLTKLNSLGRRLGQVLTVTSGFRTLDQQRALYKRYVDSGYNIQYIAAKPGQSNHESGNAVDVTINGTPLARAINAQTLAAYGLRAPVKGDPVHTELASRTAAQPPAAQPAPSTAGTTAAPADTGAPTTEIAPPAPGTPPGAQDVTLEYPGTAQHYLPGQGGVADSWQTIAQLPDLSPDTQRLLALNSGG